MTIESPRPRLGIARCLLGEEVRYDGTHKLDRYLRDTLGQFVEWVPVCPEVECGMSVPREAIRLAGDPENPLLVGRKSGADWTTTMLDWAKVRLEELNRLNLDGYVFQFGSPTCGMSRVKVYSGKGAATRSGIGMWGRMVMDRFPLLPFEDDGRLRDPAIRENFISRLFTLRRWREAMGPQATPGKLVDFHSRHKLLVMAHSVDRYRSLGKLVATAGTDPLEQVCKNYLEGLLAALTLKPTPGKHANVLQHAMGYFKKELTPEEKEELGTLIDQFRIGLLPLIVPITLLNHYVRKYGKDYLAKQYYLTPYPAELMLRNHV
ncbi:YbgA family protein [Pseudodesulfovibrio sp.]|uniref:YbgA family protein n=1 Tax=unclassified Pseudodesulfovibrio TaxID=2661612 RepID=UPI003AFF76EF